MGKKQLQSKKKSGSPGDPTKNSDHGRRKSISECNLTVQFFQSGFQPGQLIPSQWRPGREIEMKGIDESAVLRDPVMQVGSGRPAGAADITDPLSLYDTDIGTNLGMKSGEMIIMCGISIGVTDDNIIAFFWVVPCTEDDSPGGCPDCCPGGCPQINAPVAGRETEHRMLSLTKARCDTHKRQRAAEEKFPDRSAVRMKISGVSIFIPGEKHPQNAAPGSELSEPDVAIISKSAADVESVHQQEIGVTRPDVSVKVNIISENLCQAVCEPSVFSEIKD
jgi:hypothetical protein